MGGAARRIIRWLAVLQVWVVYSDLYHIRVCMDWAYAHSGIVDRLSTGGALDLIVMYFMYYTCDIYHKRG